MKKIVFWVCLLPILWTACNNIATPRKESGEWARVPEILKKIVPPTFPDSIYDVTAYGAKSDTTFDSRPAIMQSKRWWHCTHSCRKLFQQRFHPSEK